MESLIELQSRYRDPDEESVAEMPAQQHKDEFQEMCELFSPRELHATQEHGGDLFQPVTNRVSSRGQRQWLQRGGSLDSEAEAIRLRDLKSPLLRGSLAGVYENVSIQCCSISDPAGEKYMDVLCIFQIANLKPFDSISSSGPIPL